MRSTEDNVSSGICAEDSVTGDWYFALTEYVNPFSVDPEPLTADDEPSYMYYVNDGVYGSFNCLLYDHASVTPTLLKVGAWNAQNMHYVLSNTL